jgi:hypothetical protein
MGKAINPDSYKANAFSLQRTQRKPGNSFNLKKEFGHGKIGFKSDNGG